ncbi:hypothetical protein Sjap_014472 [Stephania japonica]|uniref:Uncharacterized protein n=1 Tax=Stephania japonica TaxID=461633 RepID=A0AAP0NRX8_9MAGN
MIICFFWIAGPPKALDEDEIEFLDKLETHATDGGLLVAEATGVSDTAQGLVKLPFEAAKTDDLRSFGHALLTKFSYLLIKAKMTCIMMLGLGEDSISASSVLVMPMVSSRMIGFRGMGLNRAKLFSRNPGWNEDDAELETTSMLSHNCTSRFFSRTLFSLIHFSAMIADHNIGE